MNKVEINGDRIWMKVRILERLDVIKLTYLGL
jgi:hypothetical protein